MAYTLRPMPTWPYPPTDPRRDAQFKVAQPRDANNNYVAPKRVHWDQTLAELEYEVWAVGGHDVVIGVGLEPRDIRNDGLPRADARAVRHPGVEISFESRYGKLTYATDVFVDWRDNVRAIAKGLEALRSLERWGVSRRGQQYAGFAQLAAGGPDPVRGKALLERAGGKVAALKAHHPDHGGQDRDFVDVMAYVREAGL